MEDEKRGEKTKLLLQDISFRCDVVEAFVLRCHAAYAGSCLPTFRDNLSVLSSMVKQSKNNVGQRVDSLLYKGWCERSQDLGEAGSKSGCHVLVATLNSSNMVDPFT